MPFAHWFFRLVKRALPLGRATSAIVAASISTAAGSSAGAQATGAPPRPTGSSTRDTVRRYGEKFVLSPTDSVVVRADTTWFPRKGGAMAAEGLISSPTAPGGERAATGKPRGAPPIPKVDSVATRPVPIRSSGGGHGSHASHASHASHRSMVGIRSEL
jgi:hypothetical protein